MGDAEDPTARLNTLSGEIDGLLGNIDSLIGEIEVFVGQMAALSTSPADYVAYGQKISSIDNRISGGAGKVLDLADAIIAKGTEATSKSQGEGFRLEGIGADMDKLSAKLGYISGLLQGEKVRWATNVANFVYNLGVMQDSLGARQDVAEAIYENEAYWTVPGDHPDQDITGVNEYSDDILASLTAIKTAQANIEDDADYLWDNAGDDDNDYDDAEFAYHSGTDLISDLAFKDGDGTTVVAKAYLAKAETVGDDFAVKGIQALLKQVDAIINEEINFLNALIAETDPGDILTNLTAARTKLNAAHTAVIGVF